ncbi:MAG TPA: hypothetical protein VKT78_05475, partial [Fimbriimonadaceae bacterium]|nr:hypothetical protein [Fimbriimonadaceae bacterium]
SRYAEDLLQIARTVRLNRPALTIPMALKNDVGRRIEMVLDNNKRRGSVHLGGLALAALGFAALTIPAASLLLHRQGDESTLQYADLAGNKTVAGTEANGFVARLADGRKVELVQVSWLQRDGTVQAWRPNGVPIPPKDQLARAYHGPDEKDRLEFVYRVQAAGTVVHSGMDLANESRSPGRTEFFGEGLALRPGSDGNVTLVANMAIRQRGVADPTSFVFYIADGEGRTAATYSAATGAVTDDPDLGAGLTVTPNAASTTVAYDYAPTPFVYLADAVGITRSGKTVQPKPLSSKRVKGGLFRITDSFPRTADLAKIEVQLHDVRAVEMKGVHIRPNTFVTE